MQTIKFQQAIAEGTLLEIHLISGETYRGICTKGKLADSFELKTDKGLLSLPYWTIKRFKKI
ncbi:hypothetical protein D3C72_2125900 [compost metagenome]